MAAFIGLSTQPVYYNNRRIVGAKVYTYNAGTNTPRTAYADGLANTEHDQPFLTDANGTIPTFWVTGDTAVKVVIKSPTGTVIRTVDNIPGDSSGGGTVITPGTGTTIPPGMMMPAHLTGVIVGWVRANGRTIGNASSGATERANADTSDLFGFLWNATLLSVSGGRGASAAADYAANKTIELPDYRGRGFVGLDDMGATASNRLNGLTFSTGNRTTLGSAFGAATIALTTANLASHTHTATTSTASDHTHSASSSSAGGFSGYVNSDGTHNHSAYQDSHSHGYTQTSTSTALVQGGASGISVANTFGGTTDSKQPSVYVNNGGNHSHYLSIPQHSHSITTASAGAHSHTLTSDATGSGTAHENAQPSLTCTVYIKL